MELIIKDHVGGWILRYQPIEGGSPLITSITYEMVVLNGSIQRSKDLSGSLTQEMKDWFMKQIEEYESQAEEEEFHTHMAENYYASWLESGQKIEGTL